MDGNVKVTETGLRHIISFRNDLEQQEKKIQEEKVAKAKSEMSSKLVKLIGSFGVALQQKNANNPLQQPQKSNMLAVASPRFNQNKFGHLKEGLQIYQSPKSLREPKTKSSPYQIDIKPSKGSNQSIVNLPGRSGLESVRPVMLTAASPAPSHWKLPVPELGATRRTSLLRLQPRPSIIRGAVQFSTEGTGSETSSQLPILHQTRRTSRMQAPFFVAPEVSPDMLQAARAETKRQKVVKLAQEADQSFGRRQMRIEQLWRKDKSARAEPEAFRQEMAALVRSMESERDSLERHELERESHLQRVKEFKQKVSLVGLQKVPLRRWQLMLPGKFFGARSADTSAESKRPTVLKGVGSRY